MTRLSAWQAAGLCAALVVLAIGLAAGCAPAFSQADPDTFESFARRGEVGTAPRQLHFVEAGQPGAPMIVFIHGTPGSWHAFEAFLREPVLAEQYHMIAVDRLGFGASAASGPVTSFAEQAAAISGVFALNRSGRPALVVGHSLGGSIAYRLAGDFPDAVGALLVISSALDPALSRPRWYNHFARVPGVGLILGEQLRIANREMMPLADELAAMLPPLKALTIPVTVVQGAKDPLVEEGNADFAETLLTRADLEVLKFPELGHFVIWQRHERMVTEIQQLMHKL